MLKSGYIKFLVISSLTMLLFSSVIAQQGRREIATINNDGSSISWRVLIPNRSVTLTVSTPDGTVFRREFKSDTTPVFSLLNKSGQSYPDGSFNYQLVVNPLISPDVKEEMLAARENGNSDEVAEGLRKRGSLPAEEVDSGSFKLVGGQLFTKNDPGIDSAETKLAGETDPDIPDTKSDTKTPVDNAGDTPVDSVTVINMDLVVLGSACIGVDCPNNPSFGFDTLRLQENNLRINFADTSNTASFPTRDWRITANESSNGGQEKLSIDDVDSGRTPFTIEGNAPANNIYVDSSGSVGFKTSTPVVELHSRDGNTPTLRLEQDGSSGFTPQTWDVAGNEANFFIRDATNASKLPFKIRPSAPTDSLYINTNGDIGLGTSSPAVRLDMVKAGTRVSFRIANTAGTGAWQMIMDQDGDPNQGLSFTSENTSGRQVRITPAGDVRAAGSFFSNGTQLNVPDYVFEPDYKLMSLDEVDEYIREHKRLPNVQSAADVKENGLNITGLSLRLLEKVEELTLYAIDQQKALEAQQKALDAQQKALLDRAKEARQMQIEIETLKAAMRPVSP